MKSKSRIIWSKTFNCAQSLIGSLTVALLYLRLESKLQDFSTVRPRTVIKDTVIINVDGYEP